MKMFLFDAGVFGFDCTEGDLQVLAVTWIQSGSNAFLFFFQLVV